MSRRLDARARRPRCCLFHGAFIASVLFLSLSLSVSLFRARKLFTHVRSSGSPYSKERERKIEKERDRQAKRAEAVHALSPILSLSLSLSFPLFLPKDRRRQESMSFGRRRDDLRRGAGGRGGGEGIVALAMQSYRPCRLLLLLFCWIGRSFRQERDRVGNSIRI